MSTGLALPRRLTIREDDRVYLNVPNDPPVEDDWGYAVEVPARDLCIAALMLVTEDQLADALQSRIGL